MLYSFATYGTGGSDTFDECLIDLSEVQCLFAKLPGHNGVVSLRFQMRASDAPLWCSVLDSEYQKILRVLKSVRGEVTVDKDGCVLYASEECQG